MSDDPVPETVETTSEPAPVKVKRERTEAQREALERARQKAMAVRAENSALKKKEQEIEKALIQKAKEERAAKIDRDLESLKPTEEVTEEVTEQVVVKKKRKPARRVIVTEVSSASEDEQEDVEVVLPREKKRPSAEQLAHQRAKQKMFAYE